MDFRKHFMVKPGEKVNLDDYEPGSTPGFKKGAKADKETTKNIQRLDDLQYLLYAERKRAVLIVLQAVDTGGKDGTIRHVMRGINPQGCTVTPFKQPSAEEAAHDFLWRAHRAVPGKGDFGIFNRSHYEDVLVVRVHDLVSKAIWSKRYDEINDFERYLAQCNVVILKFFLHISKDEQRERMLERVNDPRKNWKLSPADFEERRFWDDYVKAYEAALTKCSTKHAPWFIVPANKKWYRNLAVARILVETLGDLEMKLPKPSFDVSQIRWK